MQGSSSFPPNKFNKPQTFNSNLIANSGVIFSVGAPPSGYVWTALGSAGSGQWQAPSGSSGGGSNGGVSTLRITGQSTISGAIAFIPSGIVQMALSGNNFVIGVPTQGAGAGDVTQSGVNTFTNNNTFNSGVTFNGTVTFNGARTLSIRTITGGAYTVVASDDIIEFQVPSGSSGQCALPNTLAIGTSVCIKDGTGLATLFPIVVSGTPNVDGTGRFVMDQNWQSASFYYGSGGWRII